MCVFFTPNRFALRLNTQKKAIGKPTTSLPFTCKSVSVTLGLASHSDARPFSMPTHTPIPSRRNRLRLATLLAMTALGIAALPRAAEAFFCFSFQMGGGPRYSMWAPSSPFGPWYGPTVDYPGYPGGLGYPGRPGGGYGGFPTPYGSPWSGWGNPWRGLGGAPQAYSPYGFGSPGYGPMGSVAPWQSPWQASPWQTSPWQTMPGLGGYPYGPAATPFGAWPLGTLPTTGGDW